MKPIKSTTVRAPAATRPAVTLVHVTPAIAEQMLGKNTRNRNVRPAKVDAFARDMTAGRWVYNGETIKVTDDGTILDGQHRLLAVIKSGETVAFLVVRDLAPEAQDTIDVGAKRQMRDQLRIRGEKNTAALAAALRRAVMWENGYRLNTGGYQPTEQEQDDYLTRWPSVRESAELANYGRRYVNCPPSVLALCHHLFLRIDPEDTNAFFTKLIDGIGVSYGDPVHALRKRIAEESAKGGRIRESHVLAYVIQSWNLTRAGKRIQKLQAPKGGWTTDNFPTPR